MADENPVFKLTNPPGSAPIIKVQQGALAGADRDLICFKKAGTETFSVNSSGLPDPGGGDATRSIVVSYGDLPTDGDALKICLHQFRQAATITGIYLNVEADTEDGSSNTQTLLVSESSTDAQVASWVSDGVESDETWQTMGSITNGGMVADEYIYCVPTKASSGLAMVGLSFRIDYTLA